MADQIPIRNLWLLMLYASDIYQMLPEQSAGAEANPDELPDLIAELLCHAVEKRLHRNLTAGHLRTIAIRSRVRGKIQQLDTERHQLLQKGKVACCYDELSVDTARNRFILGALVKCVSLVDDVNLSSRCRHNADALKALGVTLTAMTRWQISQDRVSRNDRDDRLMLSAAKLAYEMRLPTENGGRHFMVKPGRDERWLRALFEKAVAGFYQVVAAPLGWRVSRGKCLNWQMGDHSARIPELLPRMKTDVFLEHKTEGKRLVIDTKFTNIIKPGYFRDFTFNRDYLYQIYAYIRSQTSADDPLSLSASGLLLHPAIGEDIDETVSIQGHCFRFSTVDLASSSTTMREQLLRLLQ